LFFFYFIIGFVFFFVDFVFVVVMCWGVFVL